MDKFPQPELDALLANAGEIEKLIVKIQSVLNQALRHSESLARDVNLRREASEKVLSGVVKRAEDYLNDSRRRSTMGAEDLADYAAWIEELKLVRDAYKATEFSVPSREYRPWTEGIRRLVQITREDLFTKPGGWD